MGIREKEDRVFGKGNSGGDKRRKRRGDERRKKRGDERMRRRVGEERRKIQMGKRMAVGREMRE